MVRGVDYMTPDDYVKSDFVTLALSKHSGSAAPGYRRKNKRDRRLHHIPFEMRDTCLEFLNSVSEKNSRSIMIRKHNIKTGETKEKQIPYIHRHCDAYRNLTIAKMTYAKEYLGEDCPCFMVSLTVAHGNVDYEECLARVKAAKRKLVRKLRSWGYKTRVWLNDAHWNGYTHCHILVKGVIDADRINKLKLFWSCYLNMGSVKHGLHVRIPNSELPVSSSESSDYQLGSIKHFASYMMKYLSKVLTSTFDDPKFIVFSAVLWKTKSRLFGFSRDISAYVKEKMNEYKSCKYGKIEASDWSFDSAAVCDNEGNVISEIAKRRAKPEMTFTDVYLYSVSTASLGRPIMGRVWKLIDSGRYVTKAVSASMTAIYERVVNFDIGGT